jgi:hypothetical protein
MRFLRSAPAMSGAEDCGFCDATSVLFCSSSGQGPRRRLFTLFSRRASSAFENLCHAPRRSFAPEQYQVIHIGLPQKSVLRQTGDLMDFDTATSKQGGSHFAHTLVTVNEETFLPSRTGRQRSGGGRYVAHFRINV